MLSCLRRPTFFHQQKKVGKERRSLFCIVEVRTPTFLSRERPSEIVDKGNTTFCPEVTQFRFAWLKLPAPQHQSRAKEVLKPLVSTGIFGDFCCSWQKSPCGAFRAAAREEELLAVFLAAAKTGGVGRDDTAHRLPTAAQQKTPLTESQGRRKAAVPPWFAAVVHRRPC